jgi:hypothetical protein
MTKRIRIVLGVAMVLVVGVLLFALLTAPPGEPVYEGKTLRRWLEGHVPNSSANPPYGSLEWNKVDAALRHIGTNAVPTLLGMIRAKGPPPYMLKLIEVARIQPLIRISYRHAFWRNEEASYAFEILGTNAACAVPGLIRIYEAALTPSSQRCAAQSLGHIGPAAQPAIPVLLKAFTNTDPQVRFDAVSAVYYIGGDPAVVVPAMQRALKDPKLEIRWNAVNALSRFGLRARSAVSDLLQALNDPGKLGNDTLREQVEIALWRIAPEKVGKPLIIEESTPLVAGGVTAEKVDIVFKGERGTLIPSGKPVPCVAQFWDSEPRGPLSLYRSAGRGTEQDHFLGQFQVIGVTPPPTNANVSVLCIVADQKIILSARDNTSHELLEVRRVEDNPFSRMKPAER